MYVSFVKKTLRFPKVIHLTGIFDAIFHRGYVFLNSLMLNKTFELLSCVNVYSVISEKRFGPTNDRFKQLIRFLL